MMFDFAQTMNDWHRMCKVMTDKDPHDACSSCPLGDYGCSAVYENIDTYKEIDFEVIGEKIAVWAAENPEPVYPTWGEFLYNLYPMMGPSTITDILEFHVPPALAEKLELEPNELEPKEG